MRGTNIYYISGRKSSGSIGLFGGPAYPSDLTADSVPRTDEAYNPLQDYWDAQAYQDWFTLNLNKYGLDTATSKMNAAVQSWETFGAEVNYCLNTDFVNFFKQYNITSMTDWFCNVVNNLGQTATNAGQAVQNVSQTASSFTSSLSSLSGLLPYIALGGVVYFGGKFLMAKTSAVKGAEGKGHTLELVAGGGLLLLLLTSAKKNSNPQPSPPPHEVNPVQVHQTIMAPAIIVTAIDPVHGSITYTMAVNGYSITDTVYVNDIPQVVPAGDGLHFFISEMQPDNSGANLTIATQDGTGAYQAVVAGFISFSFPQDQLPDVFKES